MSIKSIILATALMFATQVNAADMRTVQHSYGAIEVPENPQRVFADGPWTLGNILALGVNVVGTVTYGEGSLDYLGDAAKNIPQFEWQVAIEKIAELNPDMIISREWDIGAVEERCKLAANIVPTYCYLQTNGSIKLAQENLLKVADALNKTEKAKELIATMDERIASLKSRVLSLGLDKKTVLLMRVRPSGYHFALTNADVLIHAIGLTIPEGQYTPFPRPDDWDGSGTDVSLENLDKTQSDYLFLSVDMDNDGQLEALQNNPLYPTLPAVRNNQVFVGQTGVWNSFDYFAMNTILDYLEESIIIPAEKS